MVVETKNNKKVFLLEAPTNGYWFRYKEMPDGELQLVSSIKDENGNEGTCYITKNPKGIILGLLKYLSEETCKKFVESKRIKKSWNSDMSDVYINYKSDDITNMYTELAHESFITLLQSKGIKTNRNLLVIELND